MAILDKTLQAKVDNLTERAYEAFTTGNIDTSFTLLQEAWDTYPEPKVQWNEAYNTAKYVFQDHMRLGQYDSAKIWLARMVAANDSLHLFDEDCRFNVAKHAFDTGAHDAAFEHFAAVVNSAGMRYFEGEDVRYVTFYKQRKKAR